MLNQLKMDRLFPSSKKGFLLLGSGWASMGRPSKHLNHERCNGKRTQHLGYTSKGSPMYAILPPWSKTGFSTLQSPITILTIKVRMPCGWWWIQEDWGGPQIWMKFSSCFWPHHLLFQLSLLRLWSWSLKFKRKRTLPGVCCFGFPCIVPSL